MEYIQARDVVIVFLIDFGVTVVEPECLSRYELDYRRLALDCSLEGSLANIVFHLATMHCFLCTERGIVWFVSWD